MIMKNKISDFFRAYKMEINRCESALEVYSLFTEKYTESGCTMDEFFDEIRELDQESEFQFLDNSVVGAGVKIGNIYIQLKQCAEASRI